MPYSSVSMERGNQEHRAEHREREQEPSVACSFSKKLRDTKAGLATHGYYKEQFHFHLCYLSVVVSSGCQSLVLARTSL